MLFFSIGVNPISVEDGGQINNSVYENDTLKL